MTKVVNKYKDSYDIYIGRGSIFGNPFTLQLHTRAESIALYKTYFYKELKENTAFADAVHKLRGCTLGCFCKPKQCHGDVIVEYLELKELENDIEVQKSLSINRKTE